MPSIKFETGRDFASAISAADPLAAYRDRFHIPKTWAGSDCVYLCGHSLGLQPKSARAYIEQELEDWAHYGVEGHFHAKNPWMPYHEILTAPTARLVGALPSEVVVMNSLTVNLHLMMVSFYRPTPARNKIVIEANAFPSDQYAVQSQINFHGYDPAKSLIEIAPRPGDTIIRTEDIEKLLTEKGGEIALIILGGVNYYTGQAFDCQRITESAHAQGCVVGFDMAHAAGNLQLRSTIGAWISPSGAATNISTAVPGALPDVSSTNAKRKIRRCRVLPAGGVTTRAAGSRCRRNFNPSPAPKAGS